MPVEKSLTFESSDTQRSAGPLPFAQTVGFDQPLALELGQTLPGVTVVYETYGVLSARRDNAVLICHALSGDSHVARHDEADAPGWWDLVVGPGQAIDTDRYFVICTNILGGCRGTTGPGSINPVTGHHYGADFPTITTADCVEVQKRLVDHLGIHVLRAVVGGSLGGQQAVTWAIRFPERLRACIALATSARLTSQALAFDVIGRNLIQHDPHYHGGQYYDHPIAPKTGLALARMLAHITYLSSDSMDAKFDATRLTPRQISTAFEKRFSVGAYLAHQGGKFVERFDANSYVTLSLMMDMFDLGETPEKLMQALSPSTCRWLLCSFSSDWLFPAVQSRQMVEALARLGKDVTYCEVPSPAGHDAFLLADSLPLYGGLIAAFLRQAQAVCPSADAAAALDLRLPDKPVIDGVRVAHQAIVDLIPAGASVLDLGCGDGDLLNALCARGHQRLAGVENDAAAVLRCATRGLGVIHADLNQPLPFFADRQFDVVVLSHTLQSVADTVGLLKEMSRVGRHAIVCFPNFAFHKLRQMHAEQGRAPKTPGLFGYEWYETPNRRFPSITDVLDLCAKLSLRVEREIYLNTETLAPVTGDPNLNADVAILLLGNGR